VSDELVVSEVFGPTWQGEGPSVGRRAGFVRLGRCNLACQFCDTAYTWDWERYDPATELTKRSVSDVVAELAGMNVDLVVITGGEPLLQQRQLATLVDECTRRKWRVEVETAGTIAPTLPGVDQWNVSPKLTNSGMSVERRHKPDVLRAFAATGRAVFKFVVMDPADLDEIADLVDECGLRDVWVMPEGTDPDTVLRGLRDLVEPVLARGWNLTPRLQVLIWGDRRGV
jgi:7-cyano-7-deazaguanosine (preQ0) biosynthesis protein QueE